MNFPVLYILTTKHTKTLGPICQHIKSPWILLDKGLRVPNEAISGAEGEVISNVKALGWKRGRHLKTGLCFSREHPLWSIWILIFFFIFLLCDTITRLRSLWNLKAMLSLKVCLENTFEVKGIHWSTVNKGYASIQ